MVFAFAGLSTITKLSCMLLISFYNFGAKVSFFFLIPYYIENFYKILEIKLFENKAELQFIGEFAAVGRALTKTFIHNPLMLFERGFRLSRKAQTEKTKKNTRLHEDVITK